MRETLCIAMFGSSNDQQVGPGFNSRWSREESIAEVWEEGAQHVRSFVKDGETAEEVKFNGSWLEC